MTQEIEKSRVSLEKLIPLTLTPIDRSILEKFKKENSEKVKSLEKEADDLVQYETWMELNGKKLGIDINTYCNEDRDRIVYGLYLQTLNK